MISNYEVSSSYVQNCTMSLMNLYLQGRDKIIQFYAWSGRNSDYCKHMGSYGLFMQTLN